jgi:hypothetical protein
MTRSQDQAVWELYRKGLHWVAEEAEATWKRGQRFMPDARIPLDRQVWRLIELCNWEMRERAETA